MTLRGLAGGRIFADVIKGGTPLVVLLHGWGRDRRDLLPVTEGLSQGWASVDLPGFGASPPPPSPWGAREYAQLVGDAITELLGNDELAGENVPVVLVGHSFGGRIALCLAAEMPWVSGLLLTGVPLLRGAGARPSARFRLVRALHRRRLVPDATIERYRQRYGSHDYRAAQGVMRETLVRVVSESYEQELARVRCPIRFVWGELDPAAPLAMARRAADVVRSPHHFVVAGGLGHDIHHQRPDLLTRELITLCERAV